ncbi:hypothetical protein ABIE13_002919 [Ottowia thiooxydans]|uniref:Uncharacterized protein n=1 Tax=Ottowia thiooxydans TaxID=219182 RepID=A0ABV2Q9U0_9BURK
MLRIHDNGRERRMQLLQSVLEPGALLRLGINILNAPGARNGELKFSKKGGSAGQSEI